MYCSYVLCFVCLGSFINAVSAQDPCKENQILDDPTRSIDYELGSEDENECDRFMTKGWYRVTENGTIPRTCPEILHCGSLFPIWIDGNLPAIGETSTLKGCVRGFIQCCSVSFDINVKNCGGYLVYELMPPPICPGRYCIDGPVAPCAEGMSSESGFEPCEKILIEFEVEISVEPFIPTFDSFSQLNNLAFRCKEKGMKTQYHGYLFDYAWYVDGKEVYVKERIEYASYEEGKVLHLNEWDPEKKRTLGFQIYCAVRARENNDSVPTPYIKSKEFYAGVEIERPSSSIKSGETAILKIKSTVPVACKKYTKGVYCSVDIEMFSLKDFFGSQPANCNVSVADIQKSKGSSCGMVFDGKKWDQQQDFELKTLQDLSSRTSYICTAKLISRSFTDRLWIDYKLPEIKINVIGKGRPEGTCYSYGDPHIKTVDGSSYDIFDEGEFVLYRHRTKPIDIHTIHKWVTRSNKFAVNCAIIIKASDDMFVIYGCDDPPKWIVRRLNCDSNNQFIDVMEIGKKYEIILPTGTRITVNIQSQWLNINIFYSPSDWGETEGLCGTYNGNTADDHVGDWSVSEINSLFRAKSRKEILKNEVLYCSCLRETEKDTLLGNKKVKGKKETKADCTWQENLPLCKPLNVKESKCQNYGRNKREIDDDLEFDVAEEVVNFKESNEVIEWRNGWTEEKAVNACKSFAERSKLFQMCSKLSNVKSDTDLDSCVADIKLSGTDAFVAGSLDGIKAVCINEIRTNTSFWVPKPVPPTTPSPVSDEAITGSTTTKFVSTTTETPNVDIFSDFDTSGFLADLAVEILEEDCPNSCSDAGICKQGICSCNEGYRGEDCSINVKKDLDLLGISKDSFCDTSKRACSEVSVFAAEFYESDTISCLLKVAKLEKDKLKPQDVNMTSYGSLRSFSEVRCPISDLTNLLNTASNRSLTVVDIFLISVSLDGGRFSTESPIIVYDSTCTNCRLEGTDVKCQERDDICIVDQKCLNNRHELCKQKKKKEMEENVNYAFAGYSLGGLGLIMIPALFMYKRKS